MKEKLEQIKKEAIEQIQASDMPEKLNDVRVRFLGKKGELTAVLKGMKDVAPEERPKVGQLVNETRAAIEAIMEETKKKMEKAGVKAEQMAAYASMNTKKVNTANISKTDGNSSMTAEEKAEAVRKSTEYYSKNAKPGSMMSKANMVKQYNEKNNK